MSRDLGSTVTVRVDLVDHIPPQSNGNSDPTAVSSTKLKSNTLAFESPTFMYALRAIEQASRYDCMRLDLYRQKENISERVTIARFGSALALRFDDVGYFNRVYCADDTVFEMLAQLEEFYRGTPFGFEIVGPPDLVRDAAHPINRRAGWRPSTRFAWIHGNPESLAPTAAGTFEIRPPDPSERERFLITYLEGFEVAEDRVPAAVRNMRHLFGRSDLEFFLAFHQGRPAGVGMIQHWDQIALFCAGAACPRFRGNGCHTALLGARIRRARERGCKEVYSWAVHGGRSHSNMLKAGLETVGVTRRWQWTPESHT